MASKPKPPVALIAGPTASGKSALALALAKRSGGVVINADSAQLYRGIPVLSAAPADEELALAEHRLYGIADGSVPCSAADWATLARREIADVHAQALLPILVGGTGLYLRTLVDGIAPVPAIDPEVRRRVRGSTVEQNRAELAKHDARAAAVLNANDTTRIARALEVAFSTGRTLADWHKQREGGIGGEVALRPLILLPPRDWLYRRCDERFAHMVEQGAVEEVQTLLARDLGGNLPVMRAIGVAEIAASLRGETSLAEAIAAGQQATRRYAKRQYTWFAHQTPDDWPRFREPVEGETIQRALALLWPSA